MITRQNQIPLGTCKHCGYNFGEIDPKVLAYPAKAERAVKKVQEAKNAHSCIGVRRERKYLEIITQLNKERAQGTRALFNCGELGFALVYWHKQQWAVEWFNEIVNA